jgi:hypothetical protein
MTDVASLSYRPTTSRVSAWMMRPHGAPRARARGAGAGLGGVRGFMTQDFQWHDGAGASLKEDPIIVIQRDRDNRTVMVQPFACIGPVVARLLNVPHDLARFGCEIRS